MCECMKVSLKRRSSCLQRVGLSRGHLTLRQFSFSHAACTVFQISFRYTHLVNYDAQDLVDGGG